MVLEVKDGNGHIEGLDGVTFEQILSRVHAPSGVWDGRLRHVKATASWKAIKGLSNEWIMSIVAGIIVVPSLALSSLCLMLGLARYRG
jgi:hypothetical protein